MRNESSGKSQLGIIALTVISAVAVGCISAFMITASPEGEAIEPALSAHDTEMRIVSPTASKKDTSLPKQKKGAETSDDKAVAVKPVAPETEAVTDDDDGYTVITEGAITVYSPAVEEDSETEAPEINAPETDAPETEPAETEPQYIVIPEVPNHFLADQLYVDYRISSPKYLVTEEELKYVATIVQLEVMGDGSRLYLFEDIPGKYFEMLAVAQCVRNRMESRRFPNAASDVIFQSVTANGYTVYQFYSEEKLSMYEPTAEALVAAEEVLLHGVSVLPNNYYYFCATRICDYFESSNAAALGRKSDGTFDKREGHLSTFYAGC